MSIIEFRNVTKRYNEEVIIDNMNLEIKEKEFLVILGSSGCGKTTLLKMINKMVEPTLGDIFIKGENINKWDTNILRRGIGYVIQQIGLFPHMKVEDNISYVLSIMGIKVEERKKRALELIKQVGLNESFLKRYPVDLSGGEKQRVGVARALAANPDIILMDEPFGAVDDITRRNLQDEIGRLHKELEKTIIFVTHDIQEALKLGTKIILLNQGQIEQMGDRKELVFKPRTDYVKEFFGLNGFKSTLDEEFLRKIYEETLSNPNIDINKLDGIINARLVRNY